VTVIHTPTAAVDLTLLSPDGMDTSMTSCSTVMTHTICTLQVITPTLVTGTWTLQTQAMSSSVDLAYRITGTAQQTTTFVANVESLSGDVVIYPEPLQIVATLQKELPIAKAVVTATLTMPDGTMSPLMLRDDGVAPDFLAHDGRYAALVLPEQNGDHTIQVQFDNSAGTAEETTEGLSLAPPENGDGQVPTPRPVGENLMRHARVHISVTDVRADDHGNTPQTATRLFMDNTDVAGYIEKAGDTDVFSMTVESTGTVVVRITDLAFDMQPRLRLLAADGTTEIANADMTSSEQEEYLALSLEGQPGEHLYAEVSHGAPNTSGGIYVISAGEPLINEEAETENTNTVYLPLIKR
jgi:hypothetical protein